MTEEDWDNDLGRSVVVFLNGSQIADVDQRGQRIVDDSFLLCFNSFWEDIDTTLPPTEFGQAWEIVVDTHSGEVHPPNANGVTGTDLDPVSAGSVLTLPARSCSSCDRRAEA